MGYISNVRRKGELSLLDEFVSTVFLCLVHTICVTCLNYMHNIVLLL